MRGDARVRSEVLLSGARAKADGLVTEARTQAETMLNDVHQHPWRGEQAIDNQGRLVPWAGGAPRIFHNCGLSLSLTVNRMCPSGL